MKIEQVETGQVITVPGKEGKWCRRGMLQMANSKDALYVIVRTDVTHSTTLEEGMEVKLTGEIVDIEKLISMVDLINR